MRLTLSRKQINISNTLKHGESKIISGFTTWIDTNKSRKLDKINNFLNKRAALIDMVLTSTWKDLELSKQKDIALFAVGGYGRRELHPHSDIDLLLLSKETLNNSQTQLIENFISLLWDLGLEIGHSVRNIKESRYFAKKDIRDMSNLLESRFLIGDKQMTKRLGKIIHTGNLWRGNTFFKTKLIEQEERHHKFDNTEYNLEPDIKSSPGGLRDIHIINWLLLNYSRKEHSTKIKINKVLTEQERQELEKNRNWLSTIRYFLHKKANREEDRLLFEYQIFIAKKLFPRIKERNLAAEKLMHRYYRAALNISEINSTVIQSFKEELSSNKKKVKQKKLDNNFCSIKGLIKLNDKKTFKKNPSLMLEIFVKLCQNPNLKGISSETLRLLKEHRNLIDINFRKKKKNIDLFMQLIRSKRLMVTQLERMKQLGILGRYLPEFGRVTGQMQYDLFHIYTVDAHTLQVLRNMRRLYLGTTNDSFPLASKLIKRLPKLEVLYIAGLYHDIGKGRGKDHSNVGARSVKRFCKTHRFNNMDTELIQWLVTNHLKMSITSQKEDLGDMEVIRKFADQVSSVLKLDYLYCLTVADISATNPTLWNSWNASLLSDLYFKTRSYLKKDKSISTQRSSILLKKRALKLLINRFHRDEKEISNLWRNFYSSYFESFDEEMLAFHGYLLLSSSEDSTIVEILDEQDFSAAQILVYTKDRPNVFASIIHQIDVENINILEARLFGTKNGFCLDIIKVSDQLGNSLNENPETLQRIRYALLQELSKKELNPKFIKKLIPMKLKHFQQKTAIKIKHDMKNRWTQIDIETADRPGLLSAISKVFRDHNASIKKAKVTTYGERAEDRFCITSPEETPFLKKKALEELINSLQESLDGSAVESKNK